jgi:hypothetical protein
VFCRGNDSDGKCLRDINLGADLSSSEIQKQNFLRDQSGMKKQLLTLQQLISVMDPELYRHLGLFII